MGHVRLHLVRGDEHVPEVAKKDDPEPKLKSSLAIHMNAYADELEKKIAALLND